MIKEITLFAFELLGFLALAASFVMVWIVLP